MIAAVCIVVVCAIGVTGSLVTLCVARCNFKMTNQGRVVQRTTKRIEANCPFIVKQETEEQPAAGGTEENTTEAQSEQNLRALEEFFELQYSGQSEANTDSHRMSWV